MHELICNKKNTYLKQKHYEFTMTKMMFKSRMRKETKPVNVSMKHDAT
jgi:hypothetical protein